MKNNHGLYSKRVSSSDYQLNWSLWGIKFRYSFFISFYMILFIISSILVSYSAFYPFNALLKLYFKLFIAGFWFDLYFYKFSDMNIMHLLSVSDNFSLFSLLKSRINKHSIISKTYCEGFSRIVDDLFVRIFSFWVSFYEFFDLISSCYVFMLRKSIKIGFFKLIFYVWHFSEHFSQFLR